MADELEDTILENAQGPAKASGDAGSVEQHKLTDQIEADRYLASKQAAKSKRRGLVFNKIVPPGAEKPCCPGFPIGGQASLSKVISQAQFESCAHATTQQ